MQTLVETYNKREQTVTAAITRYKQRLIAIMQAENPKTYKERKYL